MSTQSNFVKPTKMIRAKRQLVTYLAALAVIPILAGCAHTHPGVAHCTILQQTSHCIEVPIEEDAVAATAKTLPPATAGKVAIYVLRPFAQQRNSASQVFINDRLVANLGPMTFARIVIEQGTHRVRIETEGLPNQEQQITGSATTYLQYQLTETLTAVQSEMSELAEVQAKARVARLDLVRSADALP